MTFTDVDSLFLESEAAQPYVAAVTVSDLPLADRLLRRMPEDQRIILARWHRRSGIPGPASLPTVH